MMRSLAVAFVFVALPSLADIGRPRATVTEKSIAFNTYPFFDGDPVPATDKCFYPYFRFDGQSAMGTTQNWRTVVLENSKIRVTALPGVGGRIWGALDKRTGREFVYFNHSVKFRNIAMRGPWTSGGIEFNFGIYGHSPLTATPVDYMIRENPDGSASYFAAATEYICRTFWQVEVRLGADDDFFTTHVTWFNASPVNAPYYTWMTGAYKASGEPRFYFPGRDWVGHDGARHAWPVDEKGRDVSVYAANAFGPSRSYHVANGDTRFFGIWWPKEGYGSYHENLAGEKFGRKIFFWALSRQGGIWEDLLTDTDGQYIELQSGRAFQQPDTTSWATPFKHLTFAPGMTDRYVEKWGVSHDLRDFEIRMTAKEQPAARPRRMPKDFDWSSAYGLYMKGQQLLRERKNAAGRAALEASIATNSYFAPALTCLASHEYERGHDDRAAELADRALALDTYDPEANYVAGLVAAAAGDTPTAYDRLGLAAYSPLYRAPAFCAYAKAALKAGDADLAAEVAAKALAANVASPEAAMLVSAASRRGGKSSSACLAAFERLAAELPLHHGLRYELYRRGKLDSAAYRAAVRSELPAWNFVELGDWYESAGLDDEAKELLSLAGEDALAYVRLGRYDAAKKRPGAFVLPFRRGDAAALERAVAASPSWKFRYWLALYRASKGDDGEADRLLALCDGADEASFYLYRARRRTGEARLADLEKAWTLGAGWRQAVALADYWEESKDYSKMLEVTAAAARFPSVNPVEIAHARALQLNGRNRECVDYLKSVVILPSEVGTRDNASGIWKAACMALGERELAESYPENLGVGKPFPPEKPTFTARLTDPIACLGPDAMVEDAVQFDEMDVSADGVAAVDVLLNGLDVVKPVEFSSDVEGGLWFVEPGKPIENSFLPKGKGAVLRYRLPVKCGSFVAHLMVRQGEEVCTFEWKVNVYDVRPQRLDGTGAMSDQWPDFEGFRRAVEGPDRAGIYSAARHEISEDCEVLMWLHRRDPVLADRLLRRIVRCFGSRVTDSEQYRRVRRELLTVCAQLKGV